MHRTEIMQSYTVQVMNLSPNATEQHVRDFFSHSGTIESVELERAGEEAQVAFVTFKEPYAVETAVLMSGATIVDQRVCIVSWGGSEQSFDLWNSPSWRLEHEYEDPEASYFVRTPGGAATTAQEVVTSMLSKGYVLGKDALSKAKSFDETHQVTASAAAKVASLGKRIGINDKISAGAEAVRAVENKYHVSEKTKSMLLVAEQTVSTAGTAVVNSRYFTAGALWVSGVLEKAAQAAADLGSKGTT
uniref:RRM domain-containing protein n=1 Tax=Picea sitchensis TaxID=3332 RepID=B8LNT1_PICSI|nr:unknown [Picea sitchensis]